MPNVGRCQSPIARFELPACDHFAYAVASAHEEPDAIVSEAAEAFAAQPALFTEVSAIQHKQ